MPDNSLLSMLVFLMVFLAICGVGLLLMVVFYGDKRRAVSRLRNLEKPSHQEAIRVSPEGGLAALLPRLGSLLRPAQGQQLEILKKRLVHAGLYGQKMLNLYLGTQVLLFFALLAGLAVIPYYFGYLSNLQALCAGVAAAALALLIPSFWLDSQRRKRQGILRRAVPDALDMLVLCLEGGISLPAAIQRVVSELHLVHPMLAVEMTIVQREIQLGMPPGEAFKKLGQRTGLEEINNLASVILQSDRFGVSVSGALRVHAESWRTERHQMAEEVAHKAAVKILFPTLLCIFPAIFIVLLGPAAFQISQMFSK